MSLIVAERDGTNMNFSSVLTELKSKLEQCFNVQLPISSRRFVEEEPIHNPKLLVLVGGIGLLVNLIGLFVLFGECDHKSRGTIIQLTHAKQKP